MEDTIQQPARSSAKALVKAGVLVAFIIAAIYIIRFTPVKDYLTPAALGRFLDAAGFWAPMVYMSIYTVGVCMFVPGTLLTGLGAAIFGAYWGFLFVWVGAMFGAIAAFFIGTLKEIWASGNWGELLSFKVFFSIALFAFSFFIPKIIKKIKGEEK